ncbi:MAG: imidazolonepropionase, partial [Gaiellaceae bacterium]
MAALLLRDLDQVVSPAGESAPLRGRALREVVVLERGYVLCEGERITRVGAMAELATADLPAEVVELDCRGSSAVPGLVDCHTH